MTATAPPQANGHVRPVTLAPLRLPVHGSVQPWPEQDDTGQSRTVTEKNSPINFRRRRAVDGDTVIRVLAAFVVLAVAAFAAIVSYSHIFELGVLHHQIGTAARLLPLSVDGLIASASLVMLHAARRELPVPWLARAMLALGVGATVAANVGYGLPFGWLSAVVSAWPAVAFVGSVEMAVRFVRDARQDGGGGQGKVAAAVADSPASTPDNPGDKAADSRADKTADKTLSRKVTARTGRDRAADIIRRNPGWDNAKVAGQAGCDVRTVRRARNDLAGKGSS